MRVLVRLDADDFRLDLRYAGFEVGLLVCAVERLPQVDDAGNLGGGMLSYFAGSGSVSDVACALEMLLLRARFSLFLREEPFSASVRLDSWLSVSALAENAEAWV